ncbi:hypothetical protein DFJ77DRAFT_546052 [Powellomyces hirtus]|nr:hypothetical protein DFJ77DRAFT_546052 [Powellomyces hirtus]
MASYVAVGAAAFLAAFMIAGKKNDDLQHSIDALHVLVRDDELRRIGEAISALEKVGENSYQNLIKVFGDHGNAALRTYLLKKGNTFARRGRVQQTANVKTPSSNDRNGTGKMANEPPFCVRLRLERSMRSIGKGKEDGEKAIVLIRRT